MCRHTAAGTLLGQAPAGRCARLLVPVAAWDPSGRGQELGTAGPRQVLQLQSRFYSTRWFMRLRLTQRCLPRKENEGARRSLPSLSANQPPADGDVFALGRWFAAVMGQLCLTLGHSLAALKGRGIDPHLGICPLPLAALLSTCCCSPGVHKAPGRNLAPAAGCLLLGATRPCTSILPQRLGVLQLASSLPWAQQGAVHKPRAARMVQQRPGRRCLCEATELCFWEWGSPLGKQMSADNWLHLGSLALFVEHSGCSGV